MLEQFLNHIKTFKLCSQDDPVLLAVSGGIDSMAMLHLFRAAGYKIGVAHCNFQLRGRESDEDEHFVKDVCEKLGVSFFCERFQTETFAWENGLSIQMAARDLRYAWFRNILEEHRYSSLATAHHFDDSMETIVLNLTKGTASEGLSGIPVKNRNIIRPLLFATRAQIVKYVQENEISWREDRSNLTDDYQRNFIRHQIIPKLQELNPSLATTWQHGVEKIQGDLALLHQAFDDWKGKYVKESRDKTFIQKKGFEHLPSGASVLWRYIKTYSFNYEQAREIMLALNGQSGKRFFSPTHMIIVDREALIISANSTDWNATVINQEDGEVSLGPWKLYLSYANSMMQKMNRMEAAIDADALMFPLTWKKWRNGDWFYPLGMNHRKKLSDFFVDNKLSLIDKMNATVLESDGKIVYVVGWRVDERFKVNEGTKRVLHIRASLVP